MGSFRVGGLAIGSSGAINPQIKSRVTVEAAIATCKVFLGGAAHD